MIGTDQNKSFFYSKNAIEIKSNVWMEWNYNSIIQPFITTTSYAKPTYIGPNSGWSSTNSSTINYTSSSKFSINQNRAIPTTDYAWNMKSDGTNKVTNIQLNDNYSDVLSYTYTSPTEKTGYFKIIFYAKAQLPSTDGSITSITTTSAKYSGPVGTKSFTYLVQPVGRYGQLGNILSANQATINNVNSISSNPASVTWKTTSKDGAIAYNIFRQVSNLSSTYNSFGYLGTVQKKSQSAYTALYVDKASNVSIFSSAPGSQQNYIDFIPQIILNDASSNTIAYDYIIRSTDPNNGDFVDTDKTIKLDGVDWQKIEIIFNTKESYFKSINFQFAINSYFLEPFVQISPMWLYEISESDYYNGKYFPLDSIFVGKRPGEALLNPFSNTYNNSDSFNYYYDSDNGDLNRKSTYSYMNVSNVYERTTDGKGYFQIIPSLSNKYKYYISDISQDDKGISAYYDQYLSVNKIYIKINDIFTNYSTVANTSSFNIYFNKSDGTASSYLLTGPFSFDTNGISVFYYKDGNWLNSSGSDFSSSIQYAASANSTTNGGWLPPKIKNNGQITSTQILTQMTGLAFKCNFTNSGMFDNVDDNRLHILEISPRLEIDITDYVESYSISKELFNEDSSNNFPLGFITSNSGELTINNFPVYYNNKPFSIFENKNNQTFLYDLLTQGVKLTSYFTSTVPRSDFTNVIPSFVMYTEDFRVNDINNITVSLFDSMKTFLMSNESPQYVATGESLYSVINQLLALSGFSDYSKSELSRVCKNRTQFSYFWTEESKTIAQCLQELFVSNQIGCFIDELGFMRFIDIDDIINKKINNQLTSNFDISDITHSGFNYLPNMISDSYQESLGTTIGKIIVNYRLPNTFLSPVPQLTLDNISEQTPNVSSVYSEETNTGLAHTYAIEGFNEYDSSFKITPNFLNDPRYNPGVQNGNFFIGCEAIKTDGLKYAFVVSGSPGYTFERVIRTESDINDAVQQSINQLGQLSEKIKYAPTGDFVGVTRGSYGTKPKEYKICTDSDSYFSRRSGYLTSLGFDPGGNTILKDGQFTNKLGSLGSCKLTVKNKTECMVVTDGMEANHDHFSITFAAKEGAKSSKKDLGSSKAGVGIFYDYRKTNLADGIMIFIEKNGTEQSNLYFKTMDGFILTLRYLSTKNGVITVNDKTKIPLGKNLFDGNEHRFSIWRSGYEIIIRIDDTNNFITIPCFYLVKIVNKIVVAQYEFPEKGSNYGFFFTGTNAAGVEEDKITQSVLFKEFYSCEYPRTSEGFDLENNPKYHIQTKTFLTNMLKNPSEPSYFLWQNYPKILGFKHYKNEKYQSAPITIDNVSPLFEGYNPSWRSTSLVKNPALKVYKEDLAKSEIDVSPFMFSQIVVNNTSPLDRTRTILFLKTEGDTLYAEDNNTISINPYTILANKLYFTSDKKYERVIDPNHINNSIQMDTKWIQSEKDADQVIRKISNVLPQFNSTLELDIFGNPLVQIGDVSGLWYSLKNIGFDSSLNPTDSLKYFITRVSQRWDGGLQTSLSMKPIK